MKNEMENTAEMLEASTSDGEKRASKRLGIKEFIITLIIIIVVWTARQCVRDNRLTGDVPSLNQLPVTDATMPESGEVIEKVLIIHSSEADARYRIANGKLFQPVLEVDYAEEEY